MTNTELIAPITHSSRPWPENNAQQRPVSDDLDAARPSVPPKTTPARRSSPTATEISPPLLSPIPTETFNCRSVKGIVDVDQPKGKMN